jgi:hypothetical protein
MNVIHPGTTASNDGATTTAAAKRAPSGILREQNPHSRILLCAK